MLRKHAQMIGRHAINDNMPDSAVRRALQKMPFYSGKLILVAIGKASYEMAKTATEELGDKIDGGIVITKYEHIKGELPKLELCEAGHPVLDENTLIATRKALKLTEGLSEKDVVLFLVSGGGSALFEDLDCSLEDMQSITKALLSCGASIEEINTIRKHISNVKGGRFAEHVAPAKIYGVVLSDVIGNRLDMIASGPSCADETTSQDAFNILEKYGIEVSEEIKKLLERETPKKIDNAEHTISGSVSELAKSASRMAQKLGYKPVILRDNECGEARALGKELAALAITLKDTEENLAFIVGGETVVHLVGNGKGGRNQEVALSGAIGIKGIDNAAIFSLGSDGTDGPTDVAGGFADGKTYDTILRRSGALPEEFLENNDSYNALRHAEGLIVTGPTGTNVNDISVLLVRA